MPSSHFPFLNPSTKKPLSSNEIFPDTHTTLQDARAIWGGSIVVEERTHLEPLEVPDYVTPGPRLYVALDAWETLEWNGSGRWRTTKLPVGNVMIAAAGLPTGFRWREAGRRVLNIHLDPAALARAVPQAVEAELMCQSQILDPQIERIALTLRDELAAGCPSGRLLGEGLATALSAHLFTRYAAFPPRTRDYARGLGSSDLSRVLTYIGDNLADDLTLHDIADAASLSTYHFARLFKQSTSQSPHRYVITQRVERAKSLLLSGRLTVGEVAQAVGFYDHAHFIRHFKKATGQTPRAYREGR